MERNLASTAPHLRPASEWQPDTGSDELVMYRNPEFRVEGGLRACSAGSRDLAFALDELWYVLHGHAQFRRDSGETINVRPQTLIHFKERWRGKAFINEPLRMSYMRCLGGESEVTPILQDPLHAGPVSEWGPVSHPIKGISHKSGIILARSHPPRRAESGVWACTPGTWRCELKSDEFCHFLAGHSLYTHDDGDIIEIEPDTVAFFPAGWKGVCEIRDTVRKVFLIR